MLWVQSLVKLWVLRQFKKGSVLYDLTQFAHFLLEIAVHSAKLLIFQKRPNKIRLPHFLAAADKFLCNSDQFLLYIFIDSSCHYLAVINKTWTSYGSCKSAFDVISAAFLAAVVHNAHCLAYYYLVFLFGLVLFAAHMLHFVRHNTASGFNGIHNGWHLERYPAVV